MNWIVCFAAGFLVMSGALLGLLSDHPLLAAVTGALVVGVVAGALAPHIAPLLSWLSWRLPPVPWRVRKARRLGLRPVALGLTLLTLFCGTAHAQQLTLGLDTRGVEREVARAVDTSSAGAQAQTLTAEAQAQLQQRQPAAQPGERVPLNEVNSVAREMALGIATKRAERLAWLYNPAAQGLWNVGPYLGVMAATLGQCSLKEGCSATTQDSLRKPSGWTAVGLELRITPLIPFKIDLVQLAGRIGVDLLNGEVAGLSSGTTLSYSGEARFVLLGLAHVGLGYAGQMTNWGVQGAQGGVEQRATTQHYGQFSAGVTLRGVTLTGECRVGSWTGANLDRGEFGSTAAYCGTVLSALVY